MWNILKCTVKLCTVHRHRWRLLHTQNRHYCCLWYFSVLRSFLPIYLQSSIACWVWKTVWSYQGSYLESPAAFRLLCAVKGVMLIYLTSHLKLLILKQAGLVTFQNIKSLNFHLARKEIYISTCLLYSM